MKKDLHHFFREYKTSMLAFILAGTLTTTVIYRDDLIDSLKQLNNKLKNLKTNSLENNDDSDYNDTYFVKTIEELKQTLNLETKTLDDVISAIKNNENISSEYGQIIENQAYKLGEIIADEDYTILYYNIENLNKIEVLSKESMLKEHSSNTVGFFSSDKHEILLREDCNLQSSLSHEITHMYRTISLENDDDRFFYSFNSNDYGNAIDEAITSELNDGTSYKEYINYLNEFRKIIGKEKADEIFYSGTINDLKKELVNIYNSEYLCNKLIELIDKKLVNDKNDSISPEEKLENSSFFSTEIDKIFMIYKLTSYENQIKESENLMVTYEEKLSDILASNYYFIYFNETVYNIDKTYKEMIEEFQYNILKFYNDKYGIKDEIIGIKDEYDLSKPIKLYNEKSTSIIFLENDYTQKVSFQREETRNLENDFEMGFVITEEKPLNDIINDNGFYEDIAGVQIKCMYQPYNNLNNSKVYSKQ